MGNMGIILDENLIGDLNDRNIDKFCNLYDHYICELSAEKIHKIMSGLCKSSLNYLIVILMLKISRVLAYE
jgi:hypothetical protein